MIYTRTIQRIHRRSLGAQKYFGARAGSAVISDLTETIRTAFHHNLAINKRETIVYQESQCFPCKSEQNSFLGESDIIEFKKSDTGSILREKDKKINLLQFQRKNKRQKPFCAKKFDRFDFIL